MSTQLEQDKHRAGKRWTTVQARKELEAWKKSGRTLASYCKSRSLSPQRLYRWRARLKECDGNHLPGDFVGADAFRKTHWVEASIGYMSEEHPGTNPALSFSFGDPCRIDVFHPKLMDPMWLAGLIRGLSGKAVP